MWYPHVRQRVRRARGAFYGLTPVGILSKYLSALDKAFLWRTIVVPALISGCVVTPLRSADVDELETFQSRNIKAALGLPPFAHHSALMTALNVPRVQELLRSFILRGLAHLFHSEHRLRQIMIRGLAVLATTPSELEGSFLGLAHSLGNNTFQNTMDAASGSIDVDLIREPTVSDGTVDTIRFLLDSTCPSSRKILRLMTVTNDS